jgi:molybdenum cofactor guanylyltransferase
MPSQPIPPADQPAPPLYGLVLAGGRSTRMRMDKASLAYHGKPQAEHCLDLLAPLCLQSFLSCRMDQADQPGFAGIPQIRDSFLDMGPMGGILSALRAHRHAAFLVVACDLPHLDEATLRRLVSKRAPRKSATAFLGSGDGLPEPLCAIYEPRSYPVLLKFVGEGIHCPRKALLKSDFRRVKPLRPEALTNVNHPDEFREALKNLAS